MYTYKKVGIADLDMLVNTRIQILKVINKLSDDCDMTDFEKATGEYTKQHLKHITIRQYLFLMRINL